MATETEIKKDIHARLRTILPRIVRVQAGRFRGASGRVVHAAEPGTPDLLGFCDHGRIVAIEVKKPGGVATTEQVEFLAAVCVAGGLGAICTSAEGAVQLVSDACARHVKELTK
jgi:hypothetical protein